MGFDLKDIAELLPFIVENLSKCLYIIVLCLMAGSIVGKALQKRKMKSEIQDLNMELTERERDIKTLKEEKNKLEEKIAKCTEKYDNLNNQMTLLHNDRNYIYNLYDLNGLNKVFNSNEGRMEIKTLIDWSLERDKEVNKVSDEKKE